MVKDIVGLINVMGMVFNCNVAQGYNGARPTNSNDTTTYKDLGNHDVILFYLKIYISRS
jgi:hypothetical protein